MISSYVGENAEFERQYLEGELEVELTPQVNTDHSMSIPPPHSITLKKKLWTYTGQFLPFVFVPFALVIIE